MRLNSYWQTQFKGDLRIMTIEIGCALLVAGGVVDLLKIEKYAWLLFPLIFVVVLAILLRVTRKRSRPRLD
jgi:hypothetical protein